MTIVMLLSNGFRPDPRVCREAHVLASVGHSIHIICWDREREHSPEEKVSSNIAIHRIHSIPSFYGRRFGQLNRFRLFWKEAIERAKAIDPDVVHCHDLDTLLAGVRIKKSLSCKLIYDAHEHYPALMSLYFPSFFVKALTLWEHWLINEVDSIITASTFLANELTVRVKVPVTAIGNVVDPQKYDLVSKEKIQHVRQKLNVKDQDLLVVYIGNFSRNRALVPFIESVSTFQHVQAHIWGDGYQRDMVSDHAARSTNVYYHGWLDQEELPLYYKAADIIYYGLKPNYRGAVYNSPNSLSQAMAAGRPIIATDIGDLGEMVRKANCGRLMKFPNVEEISRAISYLKSSSKRNELGDNGMNFIHQNYNANQAQMKLLAVYEEFVFS